MIGRYKVLDAALPAVRARRNRSITPSGHTAGSDPRWPHIAATLAALREEGRRAVRIVDADCGTGALLIEAVRHARSLGFTAIEGRGVDGSPALISRARAAADGLRDPAIGIEFVLADMLQALFEEAEFPADIVLWHRPRRAERRTIVSAALAGAGRVVIGDDAAARCA
ncbi:class I SAM-dependent methyltransferase [Sphingomonas sanxanigenens]|uniref:class I SAM-dependent methyltransferase n=1 Tax=Sphingomonas sanxanigenens TaxID=397260 RepID=UPI00046CBF9B|nr:class I SAM-dependent methyltransferase [Sphingomonas sanxanigenens]